MNIRNAFKLPKNRIFITLRDITKVWKAKIHIKSNQNTIKKI